MSKEKQMDSKYPWDKELGLFLEPNLPVRQ